MLCYRCGSHVPDTADQCPTCGQRLNTGELRQATATFSRRRPPAGLLEGAPFKPQDLVAGRYLIKELVGAGPLGFVFRAHDKEIDVEVALKVIAPRLVQSAEERKGFARLLRSARKLSHPNLVRVYEEGEDRDCPYFTAQLLDALSLRRIIDLRLQKGSFFTLDELEPIFSQVCAGLESAHKLGPHSDLKPENLLVLPDLLKVTDFGLGLALPRLPFVQATKAKKVDRYLAPELVEGGEIDLRADLYSVGVILGEMLSGLTPDGSVPELSQKNPLIPPGLEALYRRAVNANPNARHQSAAEFAAELSELKARARRSEGATPAPSASTDPDLPLVGSPPSSPEEEPSEEVPSDATQPVDPELLAKALKASLSPSALLQAISPRPVVARPVPPMVRPKREERASGGSAVDEEDRKDTRVGLEPVPPASPPAREPPASSKAVAPVALLIVLGVGLGAVGGFLVVRREPSAPPAPAPAPGPALAPPASPAAIPKVDRERPPAEEPADERVRPVEERPRERAKGVIVASAPDAGCPEGMRPIAAGVFKMGTAPADPMMAFDEKRLTPTPVARFCVDVFEYPNQRGTQPLVGVSWADAKRLCEERHLRLCSEAEWEKACKGPLASRWPYGDAFDAAACNTGDEAGDPRTLGPSGRFGKCRSAYGVADLSGNVSEWTQEKVIKGGSYASSDYAVRCSARKSTTGAKTSEVGFRCCVDLN